MKANGQAILQDWINAKGPKVQKSPLNRATTTTFPILMGWQGEIQGC